MTDNVLCPWCGAEMIPAISIKNDSTPRSFACPDCGANSPKIVRDFWGKSDEEIYEEIRAAALRRYEPPKEG